MEEGKRGGAKALLKVWGGGSERGIEKIRSDEGEGGNEGGSERKRGGSLG